MTMRVLTMLLAGLLALPLTAEAQKPIKVGFPMILSGAGALFGEPALKGAQMYVEELNAKGGVLGRKLEILARDTKGNADEAVRVSRELILKENVDFLVGTLTSAEGQSATFTMLLKVLVAAQFYHVARWNTRGLYGSLAFHREQEMMTKSSYLASLANWESKERSPNSNFRRTPPVR